jgi:FdhD protein
VSRVTARRRVVRLDGSGADAGPVARRGGEEYMAAEEPLELRIGGHPFTVTMRTPGDDFDLVAGHLVSEGVVAASRDLTRMKFCSADNGCTSTAYQDAESLVLAAPRGIPAATGLDLSGPVAAFDDGDPLNIVDVTLAPGVLLPEERLRRSSYVTSACGVCGKTSIDAVHTALHWSVAEDDTKIDAETLFALPDRMRAAQKVFAKTGGLHAAALFTADGELVCLREDVGRHNAVDKVLGWAVRADRLPLRGHVLAVSGRASFELVQKALAGGIPALAAVSAPSSLAVNLAAESGLTLVGFLRGRTANVYCGAERVAG